LVTNVTVTILTSVDPIFGAETGARGLAQTNNYDSYSAVTIEAVSGLAECWRLTLEQESALLGMPEATLSEWFANPQRARVPREQQQRIILLCEIYSDLHSFYSDVPSADEWPHRANQDFGGRTPLVRMLDGIDGIREVAAYTRGMAE